MRLLRLQSDGLLSLTGDLIDTIPPYAILSHTWGADHQEITFQDIQDYAGQHKEGYRKLTFCGKQAATDGLQHFWVDTCCIDKSSSAELTEAINSMFRWYQNARKCYVYLPDVSLLDRDGEETPRATWEPAFRKSRWFTRGWTLQELIAPTSVIFFSAEGRHLGDKASLETLLHEITGIPVTALRGKSLPIFSVEERLSWRGKRSTKRAEDRVYSLLGIFDIHLPLIYGEGESNAFIRLREEIDKRSHGTSQTSNGKDTVSEIGKRCIADLRVTDSRHDKTRIQDIKGGLLADSYVWVLNNFDFRQWRDHEDQRLLWIKGDPGKGKTMLLCGIIDELEKSPAEGSVLAYFFCQATDERINTATAVVRGLISMLLEKDATLISHIEKKYDTAGKALFEDTNAWQALCEIFINILEDPRLEGVCLVVDALDECIKGLSQLLELIAQTSRSTRAKWLVSSRNWPQIEEQLRNMAKQLSLEVNEKSVAAAVGIYITHKVSQLISRKGYRDNTAEEVRQHLLLNAGGTFLWVALVFQELGKTRRGNALQKIKSFPVGLNPLYQQMMQQIRTSEDALLCTQVLALLATTYRPPSLLEFTALVDESFGIADDPESLQEIISLCGSFLTIREGKIYFVHQSAKDFLMKEQSAVLFPEEQSAVHGQIFLKSIEAMSQTLKRDIYGLCHPGFPIKSVTTPSPDPLATVGYSCLYWVSHLLDSGNASSRDDVKDSGSVHRFLQSSFLYWLESLSLLKSMSVGVLALERYIDYIQTQSGSSQGQALARDAYRFMQSFRVLIESRPLQTYASALIFSPNQSLVRGLFLHEAPHWIQCRTKIAEQWSHCLATLEGHTDYVNSAVFSADGRHVVTSSGDKTAKVWDAATGSYEATLEGHTSYVNLAVFSADKRYVVTASADETAKVWDTATGRCEATLEGHIDGVTATAFSADGRHVVTASDDKTAKIWDAATAKCEVTLKGHTSSISTVTFSADARQIITASRDKTAKIWDAATGKCETTLEGHTSLVTTAAFSADGWHIVTASDDRTAKIWDAATGKCEVTLEGHTSHVNSVVFSADRQHLVTASDDKTARVWDVATGKCEVTFEGHTDSVSTAAFSGDGRHVVTASDDKTAKIWDAATGKCESTLEGHHKWVTAAAFSANGQHVVTASCDRTAKVWDVATSNYEAALEGHTAHVNSVIFSVDKRYIVTASEDETAKVWDTATGKCEATLEGHTDSINSANFSADGRHIITVSDDKTAKVWDVTTGKCEAAFEGHDGWITAAAFSADGRYVVTASSDKTAKVWDAATGKCEVTLKGHASSVTSAVFSADGRRVVTASRDETAKVWDAATGKCEATLEVGYSSFASFDPTATLVYTDTGTIRIDDAVLLNQDPRKPKPADQQDYGLSTDCVWIQKQSLPVLWLPSEYRPRSSAVASVEGGTNVVLGCLSGQVLVFHFSQTWV